jgi:uncharacterized protein with FMN-binding domain
MSHPICRFVGLWLKSISLLLFFFVIGNQRAFSEDVVELSTGAKVRGRVLSHNDQEVVVEVVVNGKSFQRSYPANKVRNLLIDGANVTLSTAASVTARTKQEVDDLIDRQGKLPPDWLETTTLSIPPTLDLNWPQPVPQGWDNSKNVGQFIWDRINPNPNQWHNGVKLMYHIMESKPDNRKLVQQAMLSLGGMYHHLLSDYPRAAYWLRKAGVEKATDEHPHATIQLADCYFHLGNKQMSLALIKRMKRRPLHVIKLLGDIGETAMAIQLAERFAQNSQPVVCYLYAGDVCRVADRLDDAKRYYKLALEASEKDERNNNHAARDRKRAEASLAAIEFYQLSPTDINDGTYTAISTGYEDDIEVAVVVRSGKIESVKVTQHREKQFYSSISETPPRIIAKQGVRNVDAVSGATITSEAIINATAKALSKGRR